MRLPLRTSRRAGQPGRLGIGLVVVLCLSVLLQMLGVPAPLLNAGESFDITGASVLEGFSLLTVCLYCSPSPDSAVIAHSDWSAHVPILAASFYRPPLT
jgi:hypothetical protein